MLHVPHTFPILSSKYTVGMGERLIYQVKDKLILVSNVLKIWREKSRDYQMILKLRIFYFISLKSLFNSKEMNIFVTYRSSLKMCS